MASPTFWQRLSLARVFQYLSKTDHDVIQSPLCSRFVRMTHTMLGVMVFITGVFAFLSASFAINTAFESVSLAVLVGTFWGLMIIWFDRAIVSARDKRAIFLRLPIAVVIGFTVSIPLEIQLFRDRLDKYLEQQSQAENKDVITNRGTQRKRLQDKRDQLEQDIQKYREEIRKWNEAMEAEVVGRVKEGRTGKAGEGPAFREAKRNKEENERLLRDTEKQLQELSVKEKEEQEQIEKDYKSSFIQQRYGFLSRYEALGGLKSESSSAWFLANLLRCLFVFIELFPALLKLFLPYSTYDAILEASRRETVQLIHQIANQRMAQTAANNYQNVSLLNQLNATLSPPTPASQQSTVGQQTPMSPPQTTAQQAQQTQPKP